MLQDPLTLYKLIVLYMLNRVTFPLTAAQISDFILGREYTNFITLQQASDALGVPVWPVESDGFALWDAMTGEALEQGEDDRTETQEEFYKYNR